jgi:hypothetical protein
MKTLLISLALFAGQMMSMQDKPVIHLKPHADIIDVEYGGSLLELQNAPEYVHLPDHAPKPDPQGNQWTIDIKNFGPRPVLIVDKAHFTVKINVSQTVHIYSNGIGYLEKR